MHDIEVATESNDQWADRIEYLLRHLIQLMKVLFIADMYIVVYVHFIIGELDAEIGGRIP